MYSLSVDSILNYLYMKNIKTFRSVVLITTIITSLTGFSQNHNYEHENSTVAVPHGESWMPVNEFNAQTAEKPSGNVIIAPAPLTNMLENVTFYTMESVCNSKKVILLKLINSNDYAVEVEWQTSPSSPKVVVTIPARKDYEGSCASSDKNIAKLVIDAPDESEKQIIQKYVFKTIKVKK